MKTVDNVGITLANVVVGHGCYNNIVNVNLGVYQFDPGTDGKVDQNASITARLRMDVGCAEALHDALGKLLESLKQRSPLHVAIDETGAKRNGHDGSGETQQH